MSHEVSVCDAERKSLEEFLKLVGTPYPKGEFHRIDRAVKSLYRPANGKRTPEHAASRRRVEGNKTRPRQPSRPNDSIFGRQLSVPSSWFQPRDHAEFLVHDFLLAINTPRSLTVWILFRAGEHKALLDLSIDANSYSSPLAFKADYAATKFLSKCAGLTTGIDTKEVAIRTAVEAEDLCRATNTRLRQMRADPESALHGVVFNRIRRKIASVLGRVPTVFPDVGWSKGRTTSASMGGAEALDIDFSSTYKYQCRPDVTASAHGRAAILLRDCPYWGASVLNADGPCSIFYGRDYVVQGNVMLAVPKNAKTDRIICYEPHMNVRLQLQVGAWIRRCLLNAGVDLSNQSINQRRARLASLYGELATLDLRMASDLISIELVFELLPSEWAYLLDDLRSKYTQWPGGQWIKNEKFSSMGNGFTFELESLIFFAVCSAVTDEVTVYGDDIIVPTRSYEAVTALLKECGFLINDKKSFFSGPFRESCGYDGFSGANVTPVYLRKLPSCLEDVVHLHNEVRRWELNTHGFGRTSMRLLLEKWRYIHPFYLGPQGKGDGHYHVDLEEATFARRAPFGIDGWWYKTYTKVFCNDDPQRVIPSRYGFAAMCAAVGPKANRIETLFDDRRLFKYVSTRSLCHAQWPSAIWS